jgi:hypothetical protein
MLNKAAKDNISSVDMDVHYYLYLPDGTRMLSITEPYEEISDNERQLVNALVDKYNEDNNLLGFYSISLLVFIHLIVHLFVCALIH